MINGRLFVKVQFELHHTRYFVIFSTVYSSAKTLPLIPHGFRPLIFSESSTRKWLIVFGKSHSDPEIMLLVSCLFVQGQKDTFYSKWTEK